MSTGSTTIAMCDQGHSLYLSALRLGLAPDASLEHLLNDANCLLTAGLNAFETMSEDADRLPELSATWWAALYTMRAGMVAFAEAYDRAHAELQLVGRKEGAPIQVSDPSTGAGADMQSSPGSQPTEH